MTMFYDRRDLRLLEERRVREIVREELAETDVRARKEFIRTLTGDLVHIDDAMKGPSPA